MPSIGSGCVPCKKSRKKCDETRPVCKRCTRCNRVCFGYRDPFTVIHNENSFASGKKNRPRGPRKDTETDSSSEESPTAVVNVLTRTHNSETSLAVVKDGYLNAICPNLGRDLKSEAVTYYVRFHVGSHRPESFRAETPGESMLSTFDSIPVSDFAVSALALATFYKKKQCPAGRIRGLENYQKSLIALQHALQNLGPKNIDACLLAMTFMSGYEEVFFDESELPTETGPGLAPLWQQLHYVGLKALLKYWKLNLSHLHKPTEVIVFARRGIRKIALLGSTEMPDPLKDGFAFGEHGFEGDLDQILVRLIDMRAIVANLKDDENIAATPLPTLDVTLKALFDEGSALEVALRQWISQLEGYTEHTLPNDMEYPNPDFFHSKIFHYSSLDDAVLWAHYYGYQMLVTHTQLSILDLMDRLTLRITQEDRAERMQTMDQLAYCVASTTPFAFGKGISPPGETDADGPFYRAKRLSLPIVVASATPYVADQYGAWFKIQLLSIARCTGRDLVELWAKQNFYRL